MGSANGGSGTGATTYTVKAGDTLFTIAQQLYGNGMLWRLIYAANQLAIGQDRTQLQTESVLTIPPLPPAFAIEFAPGT